MQKAKQRSDQKAEMDGGGNGEDGDDAVSGINGMEGSEAAIYLSLWGFTDERTAEE